MTLQRRSMRTSVVITILAMGLLAMTLTLVSGEIYRSMALDTHRAGTADYLRLETSRLREEFELRARALATHARGHAPLLRALAGTQPPILAREMEELHKHANVGTPTGVRFSQIHLLDSKLKLSASSSLGDPLPPTLPCAGLIPGAVTVSERNRFAHRLCLIDDKPYYVTVAPLAIPEGGYLYVVGDLLTGLVDIEADLGAPLQLRRSNGDVVYQSAHWPDAEDLTQRMLVTHSFSVSAPRPGMLELILAKDMTVFYERLTGIHYLVFLGVVVLTVLAMLFVLFALERTVLQPLRMLTAQLQRLRHDRGALGEKVEVNGNAEVSALAEGFNDMTAQLRELYASLERMAFTDSLTDLPNRSLFHDRVRQTILVAKREAKSFALLIMDLDRFKDINDTLGHQVGDLLLVQVAQRLRGKLRESDTVARMGGDEFAVVLPAVDEKHAGMAARMLLQALRAPFAVEDHNLSIGASIGIALYPENGVDASVLMQRADVAMYSAKTSGSGFSFYSPGIDQNLPTRLTLLSDLRQAIEQEQFELYYQPIVNLKTGKITGIEALARWRHPRDGILLPDSFIPLLEQSGMIHGLMPWVLSEALKHVRTLELAGMPLTVSVNLSMRDLQDPYIVDSIGELLQANEVDPSALMLEITESAVMTDGPRTLELLNKLSSMGLRIAIDDFGTGYSSLTYLKKLPVTTLKIDKSFVNGMTTDDNDAAIVRTSIDLAHNLGLIVVAEGVETDVALKHLKNLNCDMAQGHYVGRPLSRAELNEWLKQSSWSVVDTIVAAHERKRLQS